MKEKQRCALDGFSKTADGLSTYAFAITKVVPEFSKTAGFSSFPVLQEAFLAKTCRTE